MVAKILRDCRGEEVEGRSQGIRMAKSSFSEGAVISAEKCTGGSDEGWQLSHWKIEMREDRIRGRENKTRGIPTKDSNLLKGDCEDRRRGAGVCSD